MFATYYQNELSYLRELGREFAARNPSLAGAFAKPAPEPEVERLLESVAFLTARVRERIENAVPDTITSLAELLVPHALQPFPACSVVAFHPDTGSLRGRHVISDGTELGARPVQDTSCVFRTVGDLDLVPLTLTHAMLDTSLVGQPAIRLTLQTTRAGRAAVCEANGFRFFLGGPFPQAATLAHWLDRHLDEVLYEDSEGTRALGPDTITARTLDSSLTPWPVCAPAGLRLLREYFAVPSRFLFFDVRHLDRLEKDGPNEFSLVLRFGNPPELPERIDATHFRLHCAPVVNLFRTTAEPQRRDWRTQEYLLRPASTDPRHGDVMSVTSVVGVRSRGKRRRVYEPFFGFTHTEHADPSFYWIRRAISPVDGGLDTYFSVATPHDNTNDLGDETFSIELLCTNRSLPAELGVGDICVATSQSPTVASFTNITPVSHPTPPPLGDALHWRLIGSLSLDLASLANRETLRSLVSLHGLHLDNDPRRSSTNALRSRGIRNLSMSGARRLLDGCPVPGIRTEVELDETAFASIGDAALFARVLDEIFGDRVSINMFHSLEVTLHPSGRHWALSPRTGLEPSL